MPAVKLAFPIRGVHRSASPSRLPPGYALSARNVVPFDPAQGRVRGGQRAGTSRAIQNQVNGTNRVQGMKQITLAAGAASGVDFTSDDPYADLPPDQGGGWAMPSPEYPSWPPFADSGRIAFTDAMDQAQDSPIAGLLDRDWGSLSSFDTREWLVDEFAASDLYRVSQPLGNGIASRFENAAGWMGATPGPDYNFTAYDVVLSNEYADGSGEEFEVRELSLYFGMDLNYVAYEGYGFTDPAPGMPNGYGQIRVMNRYKKIQVDDAAFSGADLSDGIIDASNADTYGVTFFETIQGSQTSKFDLSLEVRNARDLTVKINGTTLTTGTLPDSERSGNQVGFRIDDHSTLPGLLPVFRALEVVAV